MRPTPQRTWAFAVVCAVAGGLAAPLHPLATPGAAIAGAILGLWGLGVWRWSRLPRLSANAAPQGAASVLLPAWSLSIGLLVGLALLALIRLAIEPHVPGAGARIAAAGAQPLWQRAAIIYVAAVGEELVFRVFLLSIVAGLLARLLRRTEHVPTPGITWAAIGIAAAAFAVAHFPAWSALGHLNASIALMVFALNGLAGIVVGYLFVHRGIAAAMWAHAGADCVIQLIGPLWR